MQSSRCSLYLLLRDSDGLQDVMSGSKGVMQRNSRASASAALDGYLFVLWIVTQMKLSAS